jgi:hypothetical protein
MINMKTIGKAKIGSMKPKPNIEYPYVRFPSKCKDLIGEEVEIFKGMPNGKRAIILELKGKTSSSPKVEPPNLMRDINQRLSSIEADIKEIKEALKVK